MAKAKLTAENRPAYGNEIIYENGWGATHEYQGGVEVLIILLDIVHAVLGRLLLVHRIEVEARIIGLDGSKESSENILEAVFGQRLVAQAK